MGAKNLFKGVLDTATVLKSILLSTQITHFFLDFQISFGCIVVLLSLDCAHFDEQK